MTIKNVLIVDDEILLLELLSEMLEDCNCFTASHLKEADEILHNNDIDAILCDIMMPGGGGIELYDRLKDEDSPLMKRLIFITGGSTNRVSQEFLQTVDLPVLYKPFREDDVFKLFSALDEG